VSWLIKRIGRDGDKEDDRDEEEGNEEEETSELEVVRQAKGVGGKFFVSSLLDASVAAVAVAVVVVKDGAIVELVLRRIDKRLCLVWEEGLCSKRVCLS